MKHTLTIDGYPIGTYDTPDPLIEHLVIEPPVSLPEPLVEWPLDFEHADPEQARQAAASAILAARPAMFLID